MKPTFFVTLMMSNKQIWMLPLRNNVRRGPFGCHLGFC